jgi:anaerobic selenocysteine-containing dehydrogenase
MPADARVGAGRRGHATACVLCSHNCGLVVEVEAGHITSVSPDHENPITQGYICNKGYSIDKYVNHAERVRQPLRRAASGALEPVTWEQAITEIAARLNRLRAAYPSRCIGLLGAGGQANHMNIPYALSFLQGVGSTMWFNAFAQEKTQHSLLDQWMFKASSATWLHADDHHTRYLLLLGTNPRISHRGHNATEVLKAISQDENRTLVVVDPRLSETARQADLHVPLRPGSDCYFLIGMLAALVTRKLIDGDFVARHTRDAIDLFALVESVDLEDMAARCAIPSALIVRVAEGFAASAPASIACDLGVEQNRFSTLNSYLIRAILTVTGNVGREGGNLFHEVFNPPDPPLLEPRGSTAALVSGIRGIRSLAEFEMFSPSLVPEEVLCDDPARLRALIVDGANPLLSYADTPRWRVALRRLELLVVIDPALTETARVADYVLPPPVGYEKWEISFFPKHARTVHAQLRPPILPPPPETLPEPEIYARLARSMNLFGPMPRALRSLAAAGRRPDSRLPSLAASAIATLRNARSGAQSHFLYRMYDALGPHLPDRSLAVIWLICLRNALLRRAAVIRVLGSSWKWRGPIAIADELLRRLLDHPEGTEIAHLEIGSNLRDNVRFPDGRIRLAPGTMLRELQRALDTPVAFDREFPWILSAGLRTPWTANTLHRDAAWRKGKGPHGALSVSVADAAELGLSTGDQVTLRTRRAAVVLPVVIDPRLPARQVSLPNGFGMVHDGQPDGVNINELTTAEDRDPYTGCPHHKWVPCRIDPAPPP